MPTRRMAQYLPNKSTKPRFSKNHVRLALIFASVFMLIVSSAFIIVLEKLHSDYVSDLAEYDVDILKFNDCIKKKSICDCQARKPVECSDKENESPEMREAREFRERRDSSNVKMKSCPQSTAPLSYDCPDPIFLDYRRTLKAERLARLRAYMLWRSFR